jgi:hypothetical protein
MLSEEDDFLVVSQDFIPCVLGGHVICDMVITVDLASSMPSSSTSMTLAVV